MAQEMLVIGTVIVTIGALVTYRLLGIRMRRKAKRIEKLVLQEPLRKQTLPIPKINVKSTMMVLISILVLCCSLYIILSDKFDSGSQKWAFSSVGSIMGFWLRPEKAEQDNLTVKAIKEALSETGRLS